MSRVQGIQRTTKGSLFKKKKKKSETELTAGILKRDQKHTQVKRNAFLIRQNKTKCATIFKGVLFKATNNIENKNKERNYIADVHLEAPNWHQLSDRDRKVASSNFLLQSQLCVLTLIRCPLHPRVIAVARKKKKKNGHSAKSANGKLHLNKHTPSSLESPWSCSQRQEI